MGMFDQLKQKATELGATAVVKASEVADTAKVKAEILKLEGEINELYKKIGKEMYDCRKAGIAANVDPYLDQIDDRAMQIDVLKAK